MIKDMTGIVLTKKIINKSYFILSVKIEDKLDAYGKPGQFYELKVNNTQRLRIPISIYDVRDNVVDFMIKDIGAGTHELGLYNENESIQLMGPLGNTFRQATDNENCLLITGGVGYAPLFFFKKMNQQANIVWFHGGRDSQEVFPADRIYTNDGSTGIKGFVTADLKVYFNENKVDRILTCGPRIMMKHIVDIAQDHVKDIETSLEEYMACGMGVCYGCVTKIKNGDDFVYKTVCKDGPIFQGSEVIWDE
ncbi:MAG TPA: dihydroorotate dehydrogenase electron transfer subunit [Candidatus Cloacimonadota bacterium]|nr:dihydroorotate dehydrogenase electron transfer subunit [Candidatus Cloacimonadota bacterium]